MATVAKYAKETFWAVAAKGAAFIFYYGVVYYLTHTMTVGVWGNWSAFLALLNIILLISDQGLNIAVKRYISAARDTDELGGIVRMTFALRSEEHTSELQSRRDLVCRLLLEKKKKKLDGN